ncbi:MAG: hypothetical protein KatS3mg115_0245 [Candidatus Poribacteria bacterium]|nr:MAG: hypothetical protein KatS3mg115_0245 [Candidatus Poribacteria bacterium]
MKIGITQIILGDMSLDETLRLCEAAGYQALELTFRPGKDLHPQLGEREILQVGRRCADAGIEIGSVIASGSSGGNLLSPDPEDQRRGRERVRRSLEIAALLEVSCTLLHPGQLLNVGDLSGGVGSPGRRASGVSPLGRSESLRHRGRERLEQVPPQSPARCASLWTRSTPPGLGSTWTRPT